MKRIICWIIGHKEYDYVQKYGITYAWCCIRCGRIREYER